MTNTSESEQHTAANANWQPVVGFTWELFCIGFAWVIAFLSFVPMVLWIIEGKSPSTFSWLCFWLYFGGIYKLTIWLSNKYRDRQRRNLVTAEKLLDSDPRPPVLYLRSFRDDETTSRLLNLSTEEQELAVTMLEIGPFVTLGEPGEKTPDPGAARMYVAHENWQDEVRALMTKAQLVVGRIANTKSFWWEMETAKQLLTPEKLVLLLPEDEIEYVEFKRRAREIFLCELPKHKFRSRKSESHISCDGLIYFDPDWTPRVQPLPTARLRQNYWMPGVPILKLALRPVYERLGIEWKRPPVQPLMVLAVLISVCLMMLVVYCGGMQVGKFVDLVRRYF